MSGKRRKALRKGRVRLEGVRARTLRGVSWSETPPKAIQPREKAHKHVPLEPYEPTPGSKKALLQQKRLLGKQTPSPEAVEAKKLFFFQRLVDESKRQALAQVRKRLAKERKPLPRRNRTVFLPALLLGSLAGAL